MHLEPHNCICFRHESFPCILVPPIKDARKTVWTIIRGSAWTAVIQTAVLCGDFSWFGICICNLMHVIIGPACFFFTVCLCLKLLKKSHYFLKICILYFIMFTTIKPQCINILQCSDAGYTRAHNNTGNTFCFFFNSQFLASAFIGILSVNSLFNNLIQFIV